MRLKVLISPQFELCYALGDLTSARPLVSADWLPLEARDAAWLRQARSLGSAFWFALPDALQQAPPTTSIEAFQLALRRVAPEQASRRIVEGLVHPSDRPRRGQAKREWLRYIGLENDTQVLEELRERPHEVLRAARNVVEDFKPHFEAAWAAMLPSFAATKERVARLAKRLEWPDLARELKLRVEVEPPRWTTKALRGGFEIQLTDEHVVYLIPSGFNRRGLWTVGETSTRAVYFPFCDPQQEAGAALGVALRVELDPWLVCRALGDPTRSAIVRRLAAGPQTAASLRETLDLSKANISHHIFQLREAGLITEQPRGRAVLIELQFETVRNLGEALLAELRALSGSAQ